MNEENKEIIENSPELNTDSFENMIEKAALKREERKKKKKKKTVKAVIISVLCVFLAVCIGVTAFAFLEIGGKLGGGATVNIQKGSSAYDIAEELEKSGVISNALLFERDDKIVRS